MEDMQNDKMEIQNEYKDAMNGVERMVKRMIDFTISLSGIIVLLPIYILIYIMVLVFSGGEVIYKQERIGYKGKPFTIYKFRTMKRDAEKNGIPRTEEERRGQMTGVGAFLRDHHLDELPQLLCILKGDMSIVGPRPPLPREVEQYDEYAMQRLLVTPGLTCYWQIQPYRNRLSFDEWVELDVKYIKERSFKTDWKIILRTFGAVLGMNGL